MIHASVVVVMWFSLYAIAVTDSREPPPAQQEPRTATQEISAISGEVDDVDRVGRMITIKSAGQVQAPIYVGNNLPIFDQLARGDVVTIRFFDSVIVDLTPGARMGPPTDTTADANKTLGRDDAEVRRQIKVTVTVDAIDIPARLVSYHGFDNRRVQRQVQDPKLIDGLKVGDVITITYTRAQAASIEKRR